MKLFLIAILFISAFSCVAKEIDPPFGKNIFLEIGSSKLILGVSKFSDVVKIIGEPSKKTISKEHGEDFYWDETIDCEYEDKNLDLIFSKESQILIQIIFKPIENLNFTSINGISNNSTKESILQSIKINNLNTDSPTSSTVWINIFQSRKPVLNVTLGIYFNELNKIETLNYIIDSPW